MSYEKPEIIKLGAVSEITRGSLTTDSDGGSGLTGNRSGSDGTGGGNNGGDNNG